MKATSTISTTITVDVTAQDVIKWCKDSGLIPESWKFYSIKVEGGKTSDGCKLIINQEINGGPKGQPIA